MIKSLPNTLEYFQRFQLPRDQVMLCAIYKGQKKPDHYLYIKRENDFSDVPEALLNILGRLELVMTLDLSPERKLAQADIHQVMQLLREQGYYFQMPPQTNEPPLDIN